MQVKHLAKYYLWQLLMFFALKFKQFTHKHTLTYVWAVGG